MKLEKKRELAARTFKVGKSRIIFNSSRFSEIKEAITKQDIKDLKTAGAILIKEKKGRRKVERKKTRRRAGSVKKKVKNQKKEYILLTRKLRKYLKTSKEKIQREGYKKLRREISAGNFRNLSILKERISKILEGKK